MTQLDKQALEQLQTPEKKKKKGGLILKIILLILMVVIIILLLLRQCADQEPEPFQLERELAAELGILPGMTEDEIQDRLNRIVADSMMNVSINPMPVFPDGSSPGNLRIENIPGNSCSFTVTIVRGDTGETILTTGLIDPGYYVENIALDVPLPAGAYPCLALFTGYSTETMQELGQAGASILITVQQ